MLLPTRQQTLTVSRAECLGLLWVAIFLGELHQLLSTAKNGNEAQRSQITVIVTMTVVCHND